VCVQPVDPWAVTEPSPAGDYDCCDGSEDKDCDAAYEDDSQPDPADPASVYMSVIRQQTSIGSWKLNVELSHLLNISLDKLHSAAPVKVGYLYH